MIRLNDMLQKTVEDMPLHHEIQNYKNQTAANPIAKELKISSFTTFRIG